MPKVIGYTYTSACHCPACTYKLFAPSADQSVPAAGLMDEHGIPSNAKDREGNPIHPIFDTDETPQLEFCADCGEIIGAAVMDAAAARWKAGAQERNERRALELQMKNPFNGRFV